MRKFLLAVTLLSVLPVVTMAQSANSAGVNVPASPSCVELSQNMRYRARDARTNNEVSSLQDFLNANGYLSSGVTGYFGPSTLKAIKSFQSALGLTPTGYVGPQTRAKIKEVSCGSSSGSAAPTTQVPVSAPSQTTPTPPVSQTPPATVVVNLSTGFTKSLTPGMSGPEVKKLQTFLSMDGSIYPERAVTGVYDFYTFKAVQRFQDRYNLATDALRATPNYGAVGIKTSAKLLEVFGQKSIAVAPSLPPTQTPASVQNQPPVIPPQQTPTLTSTVTPPVTTLTPATTPTYTITASAGANGTVTPNAATTVIQGGSQTYAITPNSGYNIASLLIDSVSSAVVNSYTFTNVQAPHTINALFSLIPPTTYTLAVTNSGNGTVSSSPAGISCGTTCTSSFNQGTSVTLTATPNTGYNFTGWSGACTGTGTCAVTMNAAANVTATFTAIPAQQTTTFTLSVTKSGAGTGSVSSPAGISCGTTCSASVASGAVATLTATPNTDSTFTGWSGACTGTGTCAVTMNAAANVTATFALIPTYTITASAGANGTVTPNAATTVIQGGSQTYAITPNSGYNIASLLIDNVSSTVVNSYTFANVQGNRTISATFAVIPPPTYVLTVTGGAGGTVSSSPAGISCGTTCSSSFNQGTSVTLTATPNTGYTFTGWSGACTGTGTCAVTMNAAANVTATFTAVAAAPTVTLTTSATSITTGQSATLTWSSTNATSCTASGGWTGTLATNGVFSVSPTTARTYTLSCTGAGGSASQSVSVGVAQATASGIGITSFNVGLYPGGAITFDPVTNSVWTANQISGTVSKVDVNTGTRVDYTVGTTPTGIVFDPVTSSVWVGSLGTSPSTSAISKINVNTGAKIDYPITSPRDIVFDSVTNSVWTPNMALSTVSKINVNTGTKVAEYAVGASPSGIVFDPVTNSVWTGNYSSSTVSKVNISTGARIDYDLPLSSRPNGLAFDPVTNSIWVADSMSKNVSKINVNTGARIDYPVGGTTTYSHYGVTFDPVTNSVWATGDYEVSKIDINTGTSVNYGGVSFARGITFDSATNSVWVANTTSSNLSRIGVNTPSAQSPTLTFTTNATSVKGGTPYTLSWNSTNATYCTASGALITDTGGVANLSGGSWVGTQATSGSQTFTPMYLGIQRHRLNCTGAGGYINMTVDVNVTLNTIVIVVI